MVRIFHARRGDDRPSYLSSRDPSDLCMTLSLSGPRDDIARLEKLENLSSVAPFSRYASRQRMINSPWQRMLGSVVNLTATAGADVVAGSDGSNQRSTKSRVLLFGSVSSLRVPTQVSGKKFLGEPRLPRILVKLEIILRLSSDYRAIIRILIGFQKGGRLSELLSDDYALKNGA
jgi:hypothetical protein